MGVKHSKVSSTSDADVKSQYELKEEVGRGSFAVVRRAVRRRDKKVFAIKIVKKKFLNEKELRLVHDEATTMFEINHPFCCHLEEVFETFGEDEEGGKIYLVLELLPGGNLFHKIVETGPMSERDARLMCWQLCDALRYLHGIGVVHRDIKPENMLFDSYPYLGFAKLTDFGLSRFLHTKFETMRTGCGTPGYCAPEVLTHKPYTAAVDMWSFGVLVYIILSGLTPFHSTQGTQATYDRIKKVQYTFNDPPWLNVSEPAKNLIRALLVPNADHRPTASDVLRNEWMQDLTPEERELMSKWPNGPALRPYLVGPKDQPRWGGPVFRPKHIAAPLGAAAAQSSSQELNSKTSFTIVDDPVRHESLTTIKSFAYFDAAASETQDIDAESMRDMELTEEPDHGGGSDEAHSGSGLGRSGAGPSPAASPDAAGAVAAAGAPAVVGGDGGASGPKTITSGLHHHRYAAGHFDSDGEAEGVLGPGDPKTNEI